MMNRKEFYEYVKDNVKEYLPESYRDAEIKLQEVEKKQWTEAYWHYNSKWESENRTDSLSGFPLPGIYQWERCRFLCWGCS